MPGKPPTEILANIDALLPELEAAYKDIHAHPELSMQEMRTAGIVAANHLKDNGFRGHGGNRQDGSRWYIAHRGGPHLNVAR